MKHADLADDLLASVEAIGLTGWKRDGALDAGLTKTGRKRTLVVDLYHRGLKIAAECDGGIWVQGGHNRGAQIERDCLKSQELALLGFMFVRFTSQDVKSGRAADVLERLMKIRRSELDKPTLVG